MGLGPSKSQQPISVTDSAPSPIASRHLTLSFQSHAIWQKIRRGFIDVLEAFVEPQGWRNRPPPFKSVCSTNYAQMYVDLQGNKRPLTFESHTPNLIHEIGGEDDTNSNTTRRLLLLLESCPIGRDVAYQNVTRNILNRYLLEDRGFWKGSRYRVPRFLQNDFARYWRTMGVDSAYKLRTRSGKGWAIRNIKLRMSRKLIYVSGLLACFRCHLDHTPEQWREIAESFDGRRNIVEYFGGVFKETPLEIIAHELLRFPYLDGSARKIFDSYNEFLGMLASSEQRDHLERLLEENAECDVLYQRARFLSHTFRDGLLEFFFDNESDMNKLTKNYGVF